MEILCTDVWSNHDETFIFLGELIIIGSIWRWTKSLAAQYLPIAALLLRPLTTKTIPKLDVHSTMTVCSIDVEFLFDMT